MGGFTNEELDGLNLGKNYKYPDTTYIEDTATNIMPVFEGDDIPYKFTISVLFLMGIFMLILYYFRCNGMHIGNFFKSLRDKMQMTTRGVRVSTKTMVMPK